MKFDLTKLKSVFASFQGWRNQFPRIRLPLLVSIGICLAFVLFAYFVSVIKNVPLSWMVEDLAYITDMSLYYSMISTLGIMGWTATTAICFLAASSLLKNSQTRTALFFFTFAALINLYFTFDDAFLFHERILHRLHFSETAIFSFYLLCIISFLVYFLKLILKTEYLLLGFALIVLSTSTVVDLFIHSYEWSAFLEESLKLIGIGLWLTYFSRAALQCMKPGLNDSNLYDKMSK